MTALSREEIYKALLKEIEDSIMGKAYATYVSRCLYEQGVSSETIINEVLVPLVNKNENKINKDVDTSLGK